MQLRSLLFPLLFVSIPAAAAQLGAPGDPLSVEMHGFASPGFLVTTGNNYLAKSKNGSFEFAEIGVNFTKPLTDKLRFGMQLFARDLGPIGNYNAKFDWFYLDYRWKDWLGIRAGRVKLPFGLYNEVNDIDAARVSVLLPQSVYPVTSRDFLLAQTGLELYGRLDLRSLGALDYHGYLGTVFLDTSTATNGPIAIRDLTTPYVGGGRLMWELPVEGLRIGASAQALRLDTNLAITATNTAFNAKIPAVLWVGSVEYAAHDLLLAAEYGRWHTKVESSNTALFPNSSTQSERGYVMAAYRVNPWLQPGAYYSILYPDVHKRSGRATQQHDIAATLRFDINSFWLVKLEGHFMNGTAALNVPLNNNKPLAQATQHWGVFLIKSTVYF